MFSTIVIGIFGRAVGSARVSVHYSLGRRFAQLSHDATKNNEIHNYSLGRCFD